jgi:hypothetical protein
MIRVAKKDSKILIADETSDFIEKQFKKSNLSKKYYQGESFDFKNIESSIPNGVRDLKTELMWENKFYCITFKK